MGDRTGLCVAGLIDDKGIIIPITGGLNDKLVYRMVIRNQVGAADFL